MTIWIDQPTPPDSGTSTPASRGCSLMRSGVGPTGNDQTLLPVFIWKPESWLFMRFQICRPSMVGSPPPPPGAHAATVVPVVGV